jgi:type II secretory pathway pseudopilin PulG
MKNEQNQEVRSSGMLLILGLVGFSMAIIATPWNRQFQDSRVEAALQKAEVVGYQVVQIYREASNTDVSKDKNNRLPASVPQEDKGFPADLRSTGTMGTDPWGAPYHYRILSADKSGNVRILVWSSGPNQKVETAKLDDEDAIIHGQPTYAGDDIGVLLSMTHH